MADKNRKERNEIAPGTAGNEIELKQFVIFQLGDEEYGIPIEQVRSIEKVPVVTSVPHMPDFLIGVINLRGDLIPVLDLGRQFGVSIIVDDENRIIVSKPIDGQVYGVFVSSVSEIQKLPADDIDELPDQMTKIGKEYLKGLVKRNDRLFILIDLTAILSDTERSAISSLNFKEKEV